MSTPLRQFALAALLVSSVASCNVGADSSPVSSATDQSSPAATLRSMYDALASGDRGEMPSLLRTKSGGPLDAEQVKQVTSGIDRMIAAGTLRVAAVRVVASLPLDAVAASMLPGGSEAVRATFEVDGTGNRCLQLPLKNATAALAKLGGQWYVLEEVAFGLPFTVLPPGC